MEDFATIKKQYCMCCARSQEETKLVTAQKYHKLFQLVNINITSTSNVCIWCARRCSHALRLLESAMEVDRMLGTFSMKTEIPNSLPEPCMLFGVSVTIIGELGFVLNDETTLDKTENNDDDMPDYDDILLCDLKVEPVSIKMWDPLDTMKEEVCEEPLTDIKKLTENANIITRHKKHSTHSKITKNVSRAKRKKTKKYVGDCDAKENSKRKSGDKSSMKIGGNSRKGRFNHLVEEAPADLDALVSAPRIDQEMLQHLGKIQTNILVWITEEQRLAELEVRKLEQSWLEAPHKCQYCIRGFSFRETYQKHMECHEQGGHPLSCSTCGRGAPSARALTSHSRSHLRRYACRACGFTRADRGSIVDHALSTHAPGAQDALTCKSCNKTFKKLQILKKHEKRVHAGFGRCQCPHCGKWLQNTCTYRRHLMLHAGAGAGDAEARERRYVCSVSSCGARCRTRYALQVHMAVHSHARPHHCPHCTRAFKTDTVLRCHVSRRHHGPQTFKHECDYCQKKFLVKSELRTHINWNHLQQGVKCPQCDKSYPSSAGVRKHVARVHERRILPRDKMCHVCGKGFTDNSILNKHMLVHTGERPFVCDCGAAFGQSSTLRTHQRLVHLKLKRGTVRNGDEPTKTTDATDKLANP